MQYDLLYGCRHAYHGEDLYPATDLVMGVEETSIVNMWRTGMSDYVTISGQNFTRWSKIYVNGVKVPTIYVSSSRLRMNAADVQDGDTVVVNQMGSGNSVFRSTPEFIYDDPYAESTEMQPTE